MRLVAHTRHVLVITMVATLAPMTTASPGVAATAACQGKTPTIVSTSGKEVRGTPGDDVIVASGTVIADAGDDLICLRGTPAHDYETWVYDGAGDDSIVIEGSTGRGVSVVLGSGEDTVVGGPRRDDILREASLRDSEDVPAQVPDSGPDTGADRISTGAGDDSVTGRFGDDAGAVDTVDLGSGDDGARVPNDETPDGGPGRDAIVLGPGSASSAADTFLIRAAQEQVTLGGGVIAAWHSFETVWFDAYSGDGEAGVAVRYVGTDGPDRFGVDNASKVRANLRGGDDTYEVRNASADTTVLGGTGRDTIATDPAISNIQSAQKVQLRIDLAAGTLTRTSRSTLGGVRLTFGSFEDVRAVARRVVVKGSSAANRIDVRACRGTLEGRGGNDRIVGARPSGGCDGVRAAFGLRGGPGADVLTGSSGNDLLVGGPGRDRAYGRSGRDRCVAEREYACEA